MKPSRVRIIGGKWRGRWIDFPDLPTLRPTPNRIRETLFNWLMQDIQGARCLDAFSGSGALAFEAVSRGASEVLAFEMNRETMRALKENQARLIAPELHFLQQDFKNSTNALGDKPLDIIFLDPPFHQNLLSEALTHLMQTYTLAKNHRIYFEVEKTFDMTSLALPVEILKEQVAGDVRYGLLTLTQCQR